MEKDSSKIGVMNKNVFPVITLYQPWATWIMRGWKTIETRTHDRFQSLLERRILIHAGMTTDSSDAAINNPYLTKKQLLHDPDEMINGFILGSAYVYEFLALTKSNSKAALIDCESTLRYGLYLDKIEKFKRPIPVKGEMGIWYFDLDKEEKVKKQHKK